MTADGAFAFHGPAFGHMVAELERIRNVVTRMAMDGPQSVRPEPPSDLSAEERELRDVLAQTRLAMLQSPTGARSLVQFLVAEGRRFAETDEGAAWHAAIVGAPETERLRQIWEAVSLNVLDDIDEDTEVPTAWLDVLDDLISARGVDDLIDSLRPEGLV